MITAPLYASQTRCQYHTLFAILAIHLLAIPAFFTFSWPGLIAFIVMTYLTAGLGITLAYHRLLTHQSFTTSRWMKYLLTFFACLSLQGGPVFWVATHRLHHKESDKDLDPHSPVHGFLWAHILWNFYTHPKLTCYEDYRRLAQDVDADPVLHFMEKNFFLLFLLSLFALFGIGYKLGGWQIGMSMVMWGGFLRTVYVWHVTWLVNSFTHVWGYRNYNSSDTSTNHWLIALLTFGEGWHNNHHAYQRSAKFGHRWFELDVTYLLLKALKAVGLVYTINTPRLDTQPE